MKKILMIFAMAIVMVAAPAMASGGRPHKPNMNAHIWGSDDHQKKGGDNTVTTAPNDPVNVPEPMTAILLGAGLLGLAVSGIKRRK